MQVVNGDTLYTWGAVKTREILLRSSVYAINDSIITTQQQQIDSMTVRISDSDSIVTMLYSRISDKDGQLKAKEQQLKIKDDSEAAYKTYIDSLVHEVKILTRNNWIWKGIAAVLLVITLLK